MPGESVDPDLAVCLRLDAHAPRVARFQVAQVSRPAPDLRDAVMLLTSELVTRAVKQSESDTEEVELRVWMPWDVVRVELWAARELLRLPLDDPQGGHYDVMLLGQVADRWSIDTGNHPACMWFEIDRKAPEASSEAQPGTRASPAPRRRSLLGRRRRARSAH